MASNMKKYNTEELWRKDRDHNIHPWTNFASFKEEGSLVMSHAEGPYVYDSDGNQFIDGIGGLWCVNIGYGREEMADAIADQIKQKTKASLYVDIDRCADLIVSKGDHQQVVYDMRGLF